MDSSAKTNAAFIKQATNELQVRTHFCLSRVFCHMVKEEEERGASVLKEPILDKFHELGADVSRQEPEEEAQKVIGLWSRSGLRTPGCADTSRSGSMWKNELLHLHHVSSDTDKSEDFLLPSSWTLETVSDLRASADLSGTPSCSTPTP